MAQTTVQQSQTIRFGSAKFEMGATAGSLVDVGAIRNGAFEYSFDKVEVKSDNAGVIKQAVTNERASLGGDLMEINMTRLGSFYTGVLTADTVAAAPVAVPDEVQVLTGTVENILTHRNAAGTEVTAIVVTNGAGTTTYVRDCDYVINVNADGYTTIARAYPTSIITASALIAVTGTNTITLSAGAFDVNPAPGDHLTLSGFIAPYTANNRVVTVVEVTTLDSVFTVAETLVNAAEGAGVAGTITILNGGIATGGSTLVDYSYTPSASKTLKGGGLTTFTARVCRFTNTNAAGLTFVITVFSATPDGGIVIDFPADDAEDPAMCPIKMVGVCDTTLVAGEQLFEIEDNQHTV